jgi:ribosome-associated protein YbcJ (S4-like RNA binding protein)
MRRLLTVLCLALVLVPLALVPSGSAAKAMIDEGVVLRVFPPHFAIRELDGTRKRFLVRRVTVITLNGKRVRLRRLHRGDVVTVDHTGRRVFTVTATRP